MISWSTKRKVTYASVIVAAFLIVVFIPAVIFLYQKPTCADGRQNGDETGIDCGGSCSILCSFEAIDPIIVWSRAFKVTPDIYSAIAYIQNPNLNSQAVVSYRFSLYDKNNSLITTRENRAFIPKYKVFAVFEPNINTKGRVPNRVSFEFTSKPSWTRNMVPNPDLLVSEKVLSNEDTKPRLDARIENKSSRPQSHIETVAIVYDDKENAIGASRTVIDKLDVGETADAIFTWPAPFLPKEVMCQSENTDVVSNGEHVSSQGLGVVLAIDRSGSMQSDGKRPPQPLTDVKNAAIAFINQLTGTDKVGVISFAGTATSPPDAPLTATYEDAKTAIQRIAIDPNGTQYTNLGDAIEKAAISLLSPGAQLGRRVAVLLTDGVATQPEKTGDPNYPSTYALAKAVEAKKAGVELYVIGLGSGVNKELLAQLASVPSQYFSAASTKELGNIYKNIAIQICQKQVAVIEVIPRVIPETIQ